MQVNLGENIYFSERERMRWRGFVLKFGFGFIRFLLDDGLFMLVARFPPRVTINRGQSLRSFIIHGNSFDNVAFILSAGFSGDLNFPSFIQIVDDEAFTGISIHIRGRAPYFGSFRQQQRV
jgi:hypothetical protein